MRHGPWLPAALVAIIALLLALLAAQRFSPAAQAQSSEGRAQDVIAVTSQLGQESLLYLIDTKREIVLVYGFHQPGARVRSDLRSGVFEFLAARLYRWDAMLAGRREYSLKGLNSLRDLRVEEVRSEVEKAGK